MYGKTPRVLVLFCVFPRARLRATFTRVCVQGCRGKFSAVHRSRRVLWHTVSGNGEWKVQQCKSPALFGFAGEVTCRHPQLNDAEALCVCRP